MLQVTLNMDPVLQVIVWAQWLFGVIVIIVCGRMIYKFIKQRNEPFMQIRVPSLTYIYCTAVMLMAFGYALYVPCYLLIRCKYCVYYRQLFLVKHTCPFTYCKHSEKTGIVYHLSEVESIYRTRN